jgi:hypothetical protein
VLTGRHVKFGVGEQRLARFFAEDSETDDLYSRKHATPSAFARMRERIRQLRHLDGVAARARTLVEATIPTTTL